VGATQAWPAIAARLRDARESPEVVAEGIEFARKQCVTAAEPTLKQLVERAARPDANSVAKELGLQALEALSHLGGRAALWAREQTLEPTDRKSPPLSAAHADDPSCH
jgi:hypothetical protein